MEVSFESLDNRSRDVSALLESASTDGHNCVISEAAYVEVVHLLADWPAYAGLLRLLLEGSQVSGNAVLGLL